MERRRLLKIPDELLHFADLADLGLDDAVGQLADAGVFDVRQSLVMMAME